VPRLAGQRWNLAPTELVAQWERCQPAAVSPDALYLVPRRQRGHVNSTFMTDTDRGVVGLSPDDAAARGVADGDRIVATSAYGRIEADARIDPTLRVGAVSIPHGFAGTLVNQLTSGDEVDTATGMPRLSSVRIEVALGDVGALGFTVDEDDGGGGVRDFAQNGE
jgi:anaerobic selenocysteine-containing dehydrogenase